MQVVLPGPAGKRIGKMFTDKDDGYIHSLLKGKKYFQSVKYFWIIILPNKILPIGFSNERTSSVCQVTIIIVCLKGKRSVG